MPNVRRPSWPNALQVEKMLRITTKQLGMVFPELRPRSVSGGDLELAQAHHGTLADVDPRRGGQEGRKGAGTGGKSERAGDTAQLDLGLLRPRVAHKVEPASLPGFEGDSATELEPVPPRCPERVGVGPGQGAHAVQGRQDDVGRSR